MSDETIIEWENYRQCLPQTKLQSTITSKNKLLLRWYYNMYQNLKVFATSASQWMLLWHPLREAFRILDVSRQGCSTGCLSLAFLTYEKICKFSWAIDNIQWIDFNFTTYTITHPNSKGRGQSKSKGEKSPPLSLSKINPIPLRICLAEIFIVCDFEAQSSGMSLVICLNPVAALISWKLSSSYIVLLVMVSP